jgi:protein-serine/threonine kinase
MHDEEHDHIGSGPSTPPNGSATPRPDLHDKRLPQLANSYFAQVRESFIFINPVVQNACPSA